MSEQRKTKRRRLRDLFGLTKGEARLVLAAARGKRKAAEQIAADLALRLQRSDREPAA